MQLFFICSHVQIVCELMHHTVYTYMYSFGFVSQCFALQLLCLKYLFVHLTKVLLHTIPNTQFLEKYINKSMYESYNTYFFNYNI